MRRDARQPEQRHAVRRAAALVSHWGGRGQAWGRGSPSWSGASDGRHHPSPHRSGAVVTLECVEKLIRKDMVDPVNGEKLTDRDIIVLQRVSRALSAVLSSRSPLRGPAPTSPDPSPTSPDPSP